MSTLCRSALLVCFTALLAAFAFASHVEAQGFGGFFWSGPILPTVAVAATILRAPAQAALRPFAQEKGRALRAAEVQ